MKKTVDILAIFLIILMLVSFQSPNSVKIIFKNDSGEYFKKLHVNIEGREFDFTDLKNNSRTKAVSVEKSYRYCFAWAATEKDTVVFMPIDYFGETLFEHGRLVMKLEIVTDKDGARHLKIKD